jgi:hypothetical protein
MDLNELLAQMYLTIREGCEVIPQVPILRSINNEPWEACPDFLAVHFRKQLLEIVEVSKDAARSKARALAEKLAPDNRKHIEQYVRNATLSHQLDSFSFGWRFFVRRSNVDLLKSLPVSLTYVESGGRLQVTAPEDMFDSIRDSMP